MARPCCPLPGSGLFNPRDRCPQRPRSSNISSVIPVIEVHLQFCSEHAEHRWPLAARPVARHPPQPQHQPQHQPRLLLPRPPTPRPPRRPTPTAHDDDNASPLPLCRCRRPPRNRECRAASRRRRPRFPVPPPAPPDPPSPPRPSRHLPPPTAAPAPTTQRSPPRLLRATRTTTVVVVVAGPRLVTVRPRPRRGPACSPA